MPAPQPGLRAISAQMSCSRCGRNFSRSCRSRASIRSPACHWASIAKTPSCVWGLCEASLRETAAVGLAEGIALPPDAVDKVIVQFRSMPPHGMTSMCNDLLRGNRLELPWFAGKVVELGRRHGIPTPVCNLLYAALKPHMNGKPN
jgi:ketopantoate reductase